MKVLWIFRNTLPVQFNSEFIKDFEKKIGKNNIVFYGIAGLPKYDSSGLAFYPSNYKIFRGNNFKEVVKEETPDVVVVDKDYVNTGGVDIPRATFMMDVHGEWFNRFERVKTGQIDMIFLRYYGNGIAFRVKHDMKCAVGYCPWSISPKLFYDLNLERVRDVYITGSHNPIYPIRMMLHFPIQQKYGHTPIEGYIDDFTFIADEKKFLYYRYFSTLNTSKMAVFDSSLFKYPLMKFFEVMACNTLAMSDLPVDWEVLGFKPEINMVSINYYDYLDKIKYYIRNEDERKRIAQNGMNLILNYHTNEIRAEQLIFQLEELINAKNEERTFSEQNVKGEMGKMLSILKQNEKYYDRGNLLHQTIDRGYVNLIDNWYPKAHALWGKIYKKEATIQDWINFVEHGDDK